MKWLPVFYCLLLSTAPFAADAAKPDIKPLNAAPSNVQIINGKKFFSLSNARHFHGSLNSPKALAVIHHPREEGTLASRHIAPLPFSSGTSAVSTPASASDKDKVLSIFTPDEKNALSAPATK